MNGITKVSSIHDINQNLLVKAAQLSGQLNKSLRQTYNLINSGNLPKEFQVYDLAGKKIVTKVAQVTYQHASELSPQIVVEINKLLNDEKYVKQKSGRPNLRKISQSLAIHYDTLYRWYRNSYKKKDQHRADKGKSRKLSEQQLKIANLAFEKLYLANAQGNVSLTIDKVEDNTGIRIPQRLAYAWAACLKAPSKQKHYMPKFINQNTAFTIRDLWGEYENFLDCVVGDEWKVDEFGVWHTSKEEGYEDIKATAYIIAFQDMKTRKIVSMLMTANSITTQDTKRCAMELVRDWGLPKQWILENSKTWTNADFLRFLFGLYDNDLVSAGKNRIEFMNLDELKVVEWSNDVVIRSGVRHPQSKPIERTFRIIKDEFCAYSPAYSPNMEESRKPTERDAHPGVHRTFNELRHELTLFIENDFMDRRRTMFMDRKLSAAHQVNKNRPKTIREAFEIAYSTYEPNWCNPHKLAYHYGDKGGSKFNGAVEFVYKPSLEKLRFIPDGTGAEACWMYMQRKLTVVIDQYDIYHGWIYDKEGTYICEAKDPRKFGAKSREQSNAIGKLKRKLIQTQKRENKIRDEIAEREGITVFNYEREAKEALFPEKPETEPQLTNEDIEIEHCSLNEDEIDIFGDDSIIDY